MANGKTHEDRSAKLRLEAEKKIAAQPPPSVDSKDDMKRLMHELQVHQIELEMQNVELYLSNNRLEEANKRIENILTDTQAGYFFIDTKGCYRKVNNAWLKMHGYDDPSEVLGKHYRITQIESDRHKAGQIVSNLFNNKSIENAEFSRRRKDGSTGYHMFTVNPVTQDDKIIGVEGFIIDTTEQKQAEKALKATNSNLKAVLEATADGILAVDASGKIKFYNRRFSDMWSIPQSFLDSGNDDELLNHVLAQLSDPDAFINEVKRLYASDENSFDILNFKDGREFERYSFALKSEGAIITGRVWSFSDVSERNKLEREKLRLDRQLLQAQKLESLGVLEGGIAHDFNNILTAIIGNTALAQLKLNPESPAVPFIQQIETAADRAADLARQMLAYSGKGKFLIENLDLNRLLEEMLHMLEVAISKKAILKLHLAPNLPTLEADATQIRQIVMNLVINASEAIAENAGVISVHTGCVTCDRSYLDSIMPNNSLSAGEYLFLEITDTGCGMAKETIDRIFDPFFTTKFTGRGLGMAAVQGIIRGHKGAIKVYSELGKGSTFRVLLPVSGQPAEIVATKALGEDWQGSGTVLLVDDEEVVRNIGSAMLKELGLTVITAKDGMDAVEMYKSGADFSCVILDLTMPRMDGVQCFQELRRLAPEVKIILSSGYSEQEVAERFVNMGVTGFIQKPYNFHILKQVLKAALS